MYREMSLPAPEAPPPEYEASTVYPDASAFSSGQGHTICGNQNLTDHITPNELNAQHRDSDVNSQHSMEGGKLLLSLALFFGFVSLPFLFKGD